MLLPQLLMGSGGLSTSTPTCAVSTFHGAISPAPQIPLSYGTVTLLSGHLFLLSRKILTTANAGTS